MMPLSDDKPADINNAFNTTSRYSDDISNINNVYFLKSPVIMMSFMNVSVAKCKGSSENYSCFVMKGTL